MRGSPSEPGIIPLAVQDLFDTEDASRAFELRMPYMEIYNDTIIDLLAPENQNQNHLLLDYKKKL
ncbi:unnamed protein product [Arabis nemorensis]|uniref:Kinesin motor domain-containing protein n=1 Tax=Arabis nemorensis TaxID=586526 RepID=A0A565BNQ6_9BRAS|nr:unnamed protein product [Arabis nemorensis]